MRHFIVKALIFIICCGICGSAAAQLKVGKLISAGAKGVKAMTLTDKQMAEYVKESVEWMDTHNPVLPEDDPYTQRVRRLTEGITEVDGIPLNFKVYNVVDVNAFACPDGSVRVFAALMDLMSDDELLGVIGHEIGHVAKRHSKNAFKTSLMTGALKDAIASTGGKAAALTESQLGQLGESLINAKYSQKQENEADDYGYDFLKANGKNPWGMAMAFEKLSAGETGSSSYVEKMFSSHPETQARIRHIQERAQKDGIARPE